ncbi:MAG: aminotransferase class V-fold PLP-dependent enzyme [Candidatus Nealsonbacteria bacterium]|nr:aminotransferase class V-fold PLP-dependent enzyme [Candidatus Nealsonbacteria bacterium]
MPSEDKKVYLDYAATTPVDPRVVEVVAKHLKESYGNTMSIHSFGQEAKEVVEESRERVADIIGARDHEVVFTGSATESNNLALKGIAFANRKKGKHIIISSVEHDCIMESADWLERQGFEISRLSVDKYGSVDPKDVEKEIREDTILVSVMHANNEIGTIEPVTKIGEICRGKGALFHTDAAQSFGKIPINVEKMNIDLLTGSSHKMYGPKGVAFLYKREGVRIEPLLHGGGHEFGIRSSTLNVPAIAGFAKACELSKQEMDEEADRVGRLRDKLISGIQERIPNIFLNGHPEKRLYNNANISFDFIEGESLIMQLDMMGVAASTGSACSSRKLRPSHVLSAIGIEPRLVHGSVRFSLGRWTTEDEIDYVLDVLPEAVEKLRKISPFKK